MEKVKIISLEMENVKRVSVVNLIPEGNGLTIIGGDNCQGKTSILDAICFALGGEKYRPSNLQREGSLAEAYIKITLNNGLIVERKGKNATLKVTDPVGQKAGQTLLDSFISELALNLPKFMEASSTEKGKTLLKLLGIDAELDVLDKSESKLYDERTIQGRIADQKKKYADEMPEYHDIPNELLSASAFLAKHKEILNRNAENDRIRKNLNEIKNQKKIVNEKIEACKQQINYLKKELEQKDNELNTSIQELSLLDSKIHNVEREVDKAVDYPTDQIERQINEIEETNAKIRENLNKKKALEDSAIAAEIVNKLTLQIEDVREKRRALLESSKMPLPGLSVESGELVYNGKKWDCFSHAEQLKVSAAIIRALKPECGFILLDKLESMDVKTLQDFNTWLKSEGLQAIATRVSKGEECSIIIEDGHILEGKQIPIKPTFKQGEF